MPEPLWKNYKYQPTKHLDATRTQREIADAVVEEIFAVIDRVAIADVVEEGLNRGVSRRTLTRAAHAALIKEVHNGPRGGFWEKPA